MPFLPSFLWPFLCGSYHLLPSISLHLLSWEGERASRSLRDPYIDYSLKRRERWRRFILLFESLSQEFFLGCENGRLKCSPAVCVWAVQWNISVGHSRNLGKDLLTDSVYSTQRRHPPRKELNKRSFLLIFSSRSTKTFLLSLSLSVCLLFFRENATAQSKLDKGEEKRNGDGRMEGQIKNEIQT